MFFEICVNYSFWNMVPRNCRRTFDRSLHLRLNQIIGRFSWREGLALALVVLGVETHNIVFPQVPPVDVALMHEMVLPAAVWQYKSEALLVIEAPAFWPTAREPKGPARKHMRIW